jgi:hypothetical protein
VVENSVLFKKKNAATCGMKDSRRKGKRACVRVAIATTKRKMKDRNEKKRRAYKRDGGENELKEVK